MHACDQFPRGERRELARATFSVNQLLLLGLQKSLQRILIVFVALSVACASSAKTLTVEKYLKDKIAFTNFHSSWLDGVFNGLKGANAELNRTNKAQLFCPPPYYSMTPQQVNAFFGQFITTHADKVSASDPIAGLLLQALEEAYPCP
jgi:Rap1a immunity proteins